MSTYVICVKLWVLLSLSKLATGKDALLLQLRVWQILGDFDFIENN